MPTTIKLKQWTCLRCKHSWYPRKPVRPRICPRCKSAYWDVPRKQSVSGGPENGHTKINP